jgi:glucose-1-phosphate adenylyltransferase
MGIYLFNRTALEDVLKKTDYRDFGKEVFPATIRARRVQVHLFDGYWEDIGTIKSFFEANLSLANKNPAFVMTSASTPIYSRARFLPPTRMDGATVRGSLVAEGCMIEEGAVIENSIVGVRCRIGRDVVMRNSILMGADFYESPDETSNGRLPLGVGAGTHIEGAIIDKNCRIGRNVRIVNAEHLESLEETAFGMICDGIVVVPKNTTIPDNWASCLSQAPPLELHEV